MLYIAAMAKNPTPLRLEEGLVKQLDAWAKAKGVSRTKAVEIAIRQMLNGGQLKMIVPPKRVIGFHPISGDPIYEGDRC